MTGEDSGREGYAQLINVAAGTVTVAASVLGVFGVSAGIATALLRNAPAATLTATCLGGLGVLAGLASAFAGKRALDQRPRATLGGLLLAVGMVVVTLALVGWSFVGGAAESAFEAVVWVLFLVGLAAFAAGFAALVWWHKKWRAGPVLSMAGLYLFGMAVLSIVILTVVALRTTARPTIELTTKPANDHVTVTGKVTATGLSTDDRYEISAELLDDKLRQTTPRTEVYRTYAGPDASGALDYSFTIVVPAAAGLPWVGVTAQLRNDRTEAGPEVSNSCGLSEQGKRPPAGATCATVRIVP